MKKEEEKIIEKTQQNPVAQELTERTLPLVRNFVQDEKEYKSDIYELSGKMSDEEVACILQNCDALNISLSAEPCLVIAEIFEEKARCPLIINGIHYDVPYSLREKPALYFYELAASERSPFGYSNAARLLLPGTDGIKKAEEYYRKAAEYGSVYGMAYCKYGEAALEKQLEAGYVGAAALLFFIYFSRLRKGRAKRCLDLIKKHASPRLMKEIEDYFETKNLCDGRFDKPLAYLRGEADNFSVFVRRKKTFKR